MWVWVGTPSFELHGGKTQILILQKALFLHLAISNKEKEKSPGAGYNSGPRIRPRHYLI